jgi:hypothetical protein
MTNKKSSVVYVDHTVLSLLPKHVHDSDSAFDDWHASKTLWRKFREEKVKLVTHGKETEMDIILWFNRQGCCITDTLRAIEAINEFEAWNKVEKSNIQQYKQILTHFEELELLRLPTGGFEGYPTIDETARVLKLKPLEPDNDRTTEDDRNLLGQCLADLGNWYTGVLWSDLKRTDYQINWQILESVLTMHGIEPIFHGTEGERNRYLFGLLNRAVGLTKKSCGKLPVPDSHIVFVINMVLQKYSHDKALSGISHLLHCIGNHINFYVTINNNLIQGFNEQRTDLQGLLQLMTLDLTVMTPKRFVAEVLGVDQNT